MQVCEGATVCPRQDNQGVPQQKRRPVSPGRVKVSQQLWHTESPFPGDIAGHEQRLPSTSASEKTSPIALSSGMSKENSCSAEGWQHTCGTVRYGTVHGTRLKADICK